jgi:hypothetical protein
MVADQDFTAVSGVSLEATDVLDNVPASQIDFDLRLGPPWYDGIEFSIPCSATVTFNLTTPAGAAVHLGASRTVIPVPFNLTDYGSCGGS